MELTAALAGDAVLSEAVSQPDKRGTTSSKSAKKILIVNMEMSAVGVVRITLRSHVNHGIARLN